MRFFIRWAEKVSKHFSIQRKLAEKEAREFLVIIKEARQEWVDAQNYFNEVDDSELIDYAVYAVCAAEEKYVYLYKRAKSRGYLAMLPDMYTDLISMGG